MSDCVFFDRITDLEEKLRDQTIKVIERDAIIRRLEQENEMIERKFEQSLNSSLMDSFTTSRRPVSLMVREKYNLYYINNYTQ